MPKIEKDNEQCCLGGIAGNTDFSKTADKADFFKKMSESVFPKQNAKKTLVTTGYDFRPFYAC